MALTYAQAQQIAAANQPPGGYTQAQINEWASWAVSNPDVAYSPNPAQQVKDSIVAAQVQAGERSAGNLTQSNVDQFNSLVASGNFTAAANLASSLGVDPAVTAAYVNANVVNLGLPSNFRVNASNVSSLAGQTIGPVNPATGAQTYPSGNTITVDPAAIARAQAEIDRLAAEAAAKKAAEDAAAAAAKKAAEDAAAAAAKKAAEDAAKAQTAPQRKGLDAPVLNRGEIAELYRSIGMNNPKAEDIGFWLDYAQYNPDVINSGNPRNQVINAFKAAAQSYGLTPTGDFGQFGRSGAKPTITSPILPEGQVLSPLEFATPQRGIAALRGPAYMSSLLEMPAGATNMTSAFGGSGLGAAGVKSAADELLRTEMAAGRVSDPLDPRFQAQVAAFMDRMNVSPAEYAAAFGSGRGGVQSLYDTVRPQGVFAAPQAAQRPGPFALETGVSFGPLAATPAGRAGGLVTYKEGGMSKLSAKEAGSKFDISEYIDPETGRFYINEFQRGVVFNPQLREAEQAARARMTLQEETEAIQDMRRRMGLPNFAKGGLASIAENLADKGRGGDSMLVHMSPEEVSGLRALAQQQGMDMTINPQTGLPEAFSLKKLFKAVAPVLPFLIPGLGGAIAGLGSKLGIGALASKSIAAGLIGGFTAPGKGFNFKEGLKTGLGAYAGGKLFETIGAMNQPTGPSGVEGAPSTGAVSGPASVSSAIVDVPLGAPISPELAASLGPSSTAPAGVSFADIGEIPGVTSFTGSTPTLAGQAPITGPSSAPMAGVGANAPAPTISSGLQNLAKGAVDATTGAIARNPLTTAALGVSGYSLLEGDKERQAFKAEQAAINREEEERRRQYRELFGRTLGQVPMAASGGIVALAEGGMPTFEYGGTTAPTGEPRMVQGAGDGMSDNVPANIEGVQEARLANDEFVVPADVVADIGNGSTSAGAKKLYAMMDRIRKARHGTTEQPPEIDAERLMPA